VTKVVVGHSFDPLVIYGVEIGDVVRKLINCKFTQRTGGGSGSWGGGARRKSRLCSRTRVAEDPENNRRVVFR